MQMNKKYLSVIILTAVFVLSIVICIIISNIDISPIDSPDSDSPNNDQNTSFVVQTEIIEEGGTTAIVAVVTTNTPVSGTNNVLDGIMDDIYDKSKPVIINPAYGSNINTGSEGYDLEGQAVTTIYDTVESTRNGETKKPEPEETTKKPETTKAQTTTKPVETTKTTTKTETTKAPEETTGIDNTPAETTPIDNSQGEMLAEGE